MLLCCIFCSFVALAQKAKPASADSISVTRERYIIDIYDTLIYKTGAHPIHQFRFWKENREQNFYFQNYITGKYDTLYPDLPFKDSTVASVPELLFDLILREKITPYLGFPSENEVISKQQIFKRHLSDINWGSIIEDPVTDPPPFRIQVEYVFFDRITQLKVYVDECYNAYTGKKSLEIIGVAPVKAEYGDNGVFRGEFGLYTIKYKDFIPILASYEKSHKGSRISKGLKEIMDGKGVKYPVQH